MSQPSAIDSDPLYRLRRAQSLRRDALVAGALVTCALVPFAKLGGDQLNLLARGWLLFARGELVPFGNPLSIGGFGPGPLTSWLVGLPLFAWSDFRAPIVIVALTHLVALWLLDRALADAVSPLERAAFVLFYALTPWRVEASATLWNPNYLFLVGAIHFATARRLATEPRIGATVAHVAALGLGAQLHPSVLLLGVVSLLLLWRRRIRFSWIGLLLGVALVAATVEPWIRAVTERPELLGTGSGYPFRGLVLVFPLLKGLALWFRYPSISVSHESLRLDFTERFGADVDLWLAPAAGVFFVVFGALGVAVALWATWAMLRGRLRELLARDREPFEPRGWTKSYAAWALVAAIVVFAAAPSTPQAWQGIPLVHASILPLAFGATRIVRRYGEKSARRALVACGTVFVVANLLLVTGAPSFRCGGRGALVFPLRASSPMFEELGIQASCPWPLDRPGGWWPDVLPEE